MRKLKEIVKQLNEMAKELEPEYPEYDIKLNQEQTENVLKDLEIPTLIKEKIYEMRKINCVTTLFFIELSEHYEVFMNPPNFIGLNPAIRCLYESIRDPFREMASRAIETAETIALEEEND